MKEACKVADIYEADVAFNPAEASWYGFDYFSGIQNCYKYTKSDPYYNPDTEKRNRNYIR